MIASDPISPKREIIGLVKELEGDRNRIAL